MVKFGTLKSKIEKKLFESYTTNTFSEELKNFKKFVLSNKKIASMYNLYDEISSKKGISESDSKDYVNEILNRIQRIKITESDIKEIKNWTSKTKAINSYKTIDDLLNNDLSVEKIISLKKNLAESVSSREKKLMSDVNIPLNSMVTVANQTLKKHFQSLNESEKKELSEILNLSKLELENNFTKVKNEIESKLKNHLNENSDEKSNSKINETLEFIKTREVNKIEYYKLYNLNKSL
jgi:hypothetical protein